VACLAFGSPVGAEAVPENTKQSPDSSATTDATADAGSKQPAVKNGEKVKQKEVHDGDDRIQPDEIQELFDRFDEDSNGFLTRKELFRYFVATTPPDSRMGREYKKKDYFNLKRYREFCKSVGADPLKGLTLDNIKKAYEKHYGYAHKDWVVTAGMRSLKIPKAEKQHVKDAFAHFDLDNNGFLNWPEVQEMTPNMRLEKYEMLATALNADVSEGIDLHGIIKAYTRKSGDIRKAIKAWEAPDNTQIIVRESNTMAIWILVIFFIVCLVAPITAWFCGVHKTVQGRKMVKKIAQEMQEVAKAT